MTKILRILYAANLGVVILDEIALGSVPSKSYNLMALGIPSLYIAPRESHKYAQEFDMQNAFLKNN